MKGTMLASPAGFLTCCQETKTLVTNNCLRTGIQHSNRAPNPHTHTQGPGFNSQRQKDNKIKSEVNLKLLAKK